MYNVFMFELIKNIALGLFVNGIFTILNGDFKTMSIIITLGSIYVMYLSIKLKDKE